MHSKVVMITVSLGNPHVLTFSPLLNGGFFDRVVRQALERPLRGR